MKFSFDRHTMPQLTGLSDCQAADLAAICQAYLDDGHTDRHATAATLIAAFDEAFAARPETKNETLPLVVAGPGGQYTKPYTPSNARRPGSRQPTPATHPAGLPSPVGL